MLYFYLAYFHFVATEQPGVAAAAMWTCTAMGDSRIFTLALVTPCDGGYCVHLQLTPAKQRLFVGSPSPAVGEQMWYHGGNLTDVHHHR